MQKKKVCDKNHHTFVTKTLTKLGIEKNEYSLNMENTGLTSYSVVKN